jgi:adenylate cyclase
MRARNVSRLRIVIGVTLGMAALGGALSYGAGSRAAIVNAVASASTGCLLTLFEVVVQGPAAAALERVPVAAVMALRLLVYGTLFRSASLFAHVAGMAMSGSSMPPEAVSSPIDLFDSILLALLINAIFLMRGLMGSRTLLAFITGRYHRPRLEDRLVMFLDLRGSTSIAERLGDLAYHRFLNRLVADISEPVTEADGDIYRYIGDEIIVTWSLGRRNAAWRALPCLLAIEDALAPRRLDYLAVFGVAPQMRAALHAGPVVAGEIGQMRREIMILGDTMNATARIEDMCRQTGQDFIASAAALRAAGPLPAALRADPLGPMRLRGKEEEIELFALMRLLQPAWEAPVETTPAPGLAAPHRTCRWMTSVMACAIGYGRSSASGVAEDRVGWLSRRSGR